MVSPGHEHQVQDLSGQPSLAVDHLEDTPGSPETLMEVFCALSFSGIMVLGLHWVSSAPGHN